MSRNTLKEITPLTQADCFALFSRQKNDFDFPLHYHQEYELNFIRNARHAQRVVGNHTEEISDLDLVLVGPNLAHTWCMHNCKSREIYEVTILFHKDLFDDKLLRRNQLSCMRHMFEQSGQGIAFSKDTIQQLAPRILALNKKHGFESVLELISILHALSTSKNMRTLSDTAFSHTGQWYNSRRVEKTMEYINRNFHKTVTLAEVAGLSNMTEAAFSRFFKSKTGMTFIDCLNETRLGNASRLLIESVQPIAAIAYCCGFHNLSNFNRIFKKKKGTTPKDFRERYSGSGRQIFV